MGVFTNHYITVPWGEKEKKKKKQTRNTFPKDRGGNPINVMAPSLVAKMIDSWIRSEDENQAMGDRAGSGGGQSVE